MEPFITMRNLEKCVKMKAGPLYLLRQIQLEIQEGEFVTVMGPSGAGKTTLLNILGLYDRDWEGEYALLGNAVHRLAPKESAALNKRYVGFVFQQFHLLDDLTVAENLDIPLSYRNLPRAERQALVADTLDRFGIVGKKDLYPTQLSGGQQQLVAVARALIAKPALLLADEPTGNLHTDQGFQIMELFRKLNQEGMTIVQVTHNEAWAAYGHRTLRMRDGWMEASRGEGRASRCRQRHARPGIRNESAWPSILTGFRPKARACGHDPFRSMFGYGQAFTDTRFQ